MQVEQASNKRRKSNGSGNAGRLLLGGDGADTDLLAELREFRTEVSWVGLGYCALRL
jgi:hypothetical protein